MRKLSNIGLPQQSRASCSIMSMEHILGVDRMFDLTSGNLTPVVNFEGISKNVMTVGFQVGD